MMTIETVGQYSANIQRRNFYDLDFRRKTESILIAFAEHFKMDPLFFEWSNIGSGEDDLMELGIALRINKNYAIRYKLVSEDFELWYYDSKDPRTITDLENSDCLEDMMSELFRNLAEDQAKLKAHQYFDLVDERGDFPKAPEEDAPTQRQRKQHTKLELPPIKAFG